MIGDLRGRAGWINPVTGDDGEGGADDGLGPEDGDDAGADNDDNDLPEREAA